MTEQRRGIGWIWPRLRRSWLPLVLVFVVVAGGVAVVGVVRPASRVATASVLINPLDGNPYSTGSRGQNLTNLQTESQLVTSDAVVAIAKRTIGTDEDFPALAAKVSVDTPSNTQVLEISFAARTTPAAVAGANAFAKAYLATRAQRADANAASQLALYTAEANKIRAAMTSTGADLANTSATSPRGQVLTQQLTVYASQLAKVQATISDLRTSQPEPGQVITPAADATGGLGLPVYLLAGLLLGLLAAAFLAGWLAFSDDRVYVPADLSRAGFTALGDAAPLSTVDAPTTDADRSRRVMVSVGATAPATLLVVDAAVAAARLAISFAKADNSVILIDAARGALTEALDEPAIPGLSEVLVRKREAVKLLRRPRPRLAFLASGADPDAAADRFQSDRWSAQLALLAQHADYVVLSASATDSLALASSSSAAILCATAGQTRVRDLRATADELERCGGSVLGVFLTAGEAVSDCHPAAESEQEQSISPAQSESDRVDVAAAERPSPRPKQAERTAAGRP
ncbi:CpsD/CapB family tyrosine-protein kinase [Fodinicola acaciae]|uniref:CpsD/CapB family tyrosine-protein kinase n=1 Tax=Fodinicola acaciae TaxID=2681555 RepID=UPI0013D0DDB4|nr:CpsD/CapB family tyrosine-protein kinase [Fodinicola acaciae]